MEHRIPQPERRRIETSDRLRGVVDIVDTLELQVEEYAHRELGLRDRRQLLEDIEATVGRVDGLLDTVRSLISHEKERHGWRD